MALQTNAFTTYGAVGNREDLTGVIYDISPTETPVVTSLGRTKAKAVLHEWQTDALASASTSNAVLEGDVVTGTASTATTRLQNTCQISRKDVVVTGTQESVDKAGRDSEFRYQTVKRGKELLRDMEAIITGNQGAVTGNATTARKLRSIESWITTNTNRNTAATATPGANSTAQTAGATDASALRTLTEAMVKNVVQQCYSSGGMTTGDEFLNVGPYNKGVISGFTGRSSARQNIGETKIQAAAHLYASDFGDVKIVPNLFSRERTATLVCPEYAAVAYLRPIKRDDLAKTGDSMRKVILTEYTLEMRNEKAFGVIADLNTAAT
jgi:hypothetical protein